MKSTNEVVIKSLRELASTHPCFNAVMHVFALRDRARNQVTIGALLQRMEKEKYSFSKASYQEVLNHLHKLGFGVLKHDRNANPVALTDIHTTLQSIGLAAIASSTRLDVFKQRNKYQAIIQAKQNIKERIVVPVLAPPVKPNPAPSKRIEYPTSLTIHIGGKPVNFRIPTNLTGQEIAALVSNFHDRAMESDAIEYPVALTAVISGRPVSLTVPKNISADEIASLVMKFHDKERII